MAARPAAKFIGGMLMGIGTALCFTGLGAVVGAPMAAGGFALFVASTHLSASDRNPVEESLPSHIGKSMLWAAAGVAFIVVAGVMLLAAAGGSGDCGGCGGSGPSSRDQTDEPKQQVLAD